MSLKKKKKQKKKIMKLYQQKKKIFQKIYEASLFYWDVAYHDYFQKSNRQIRKIYF